MKSLSKLLIDIQEALKEEAPMLNDNALNIEYKKLVQKLSALKSQLTVQRSIIEEYKNGLTTLQIDINDVKLKERFKLSDEELHNFKKTINNIKLLNEKLEELKINYGDIDTKVNEYTLGDFSISQLNGLTNVVEHSFDAANSEIIEQSSNKVKEEATVFALKKVIKNKDKEIAALKTQLKKASEMEEEHVKYSLE